MVFDLMVIEDEIEFEYNEKSEKGPSKWGDLNKEWETCKNGTIQSPIDLFPDRLTIVRNRQHWEMNYISTQATLNNSGHDISLHWVFGEAGSIKINGTEFFLKQTHWHIPSEHTINGIRYDMEMHMVHISTDKKIAVIGIFYKLGFTDPFLYQVMKRASNISEKGTGKNIGIINPNLINIWKRHMHYRYIGSLTTPPCTEGVIWTIKRRVRTVSDKQIELLRGAVQEYARMNARPIQALNERDIKLYVY
ncbi:alpha carbonic anhydrase 7-like [Impatiens glandulifera]|uniref:alpha carbonic anhydrase 7-like n=1 Tax=Impatiens glandulifera TaxID=253017 RepID=UPI001FB0B350|nr:alpha carbonic anhydrase 7-like [Impatiens glandulifera]